MTTMRDAFLEVLKANPGDSTTRSVFADWLTDNGDPELAATLREHPCLKCKGTGKAPPDKSWLDECPACGGKRVTTGKEISEVADLVGQILLKVEKNHVKNEEEIKFTLLDGRCFRLYHAQDCCESVYVEDVIGSLDDLVGLPLTMAEETTNSETHPEGKDRNDESFTWTFYRFATVRGYVTIRWFGSSNGYYSESVSFVEVVK